MSLPSISYSINIPNPPDNPAIDVIQMQANANAIDSIVRLDHVAFNANNNSGAHNQCNFISTSEGNKPTAPATLAGVGPEHTSATLYCSVINEGGTLGKQPELFFIRGNDLTDQIQLTGPGLPAAAGEFGITFLPGGFLLQWGTVTASGSGSRDYLFDSNSPNMDFPVKCMQVFAQSGVTSPLTLLTSNWSISTFDATGFTLLTTSTIGSGTPFSWMAIGF